MKAFFGHIRFILPALLLGAGLTVSCGKLQSPEANGGDGGQKGDATVTLHINSAPDTKAEDGSTKYAKDGDKMNNLRVWMVDGSNKVSAYASSANTGEVTFSTDATTATVTFSDVTRGNYTIYLLANDTASLTSYVAGSTIDDSFTKATLSLPNSSLTYPKYDETAGMPLSLKKSISVGPGVNHISAEIVRVCGQINVTINNRTTANKIYITGVSLSQRSPSGGYVFQQDDHSSPTGTTLGNLASNTTLTCIKPGESSKMLSCYLFENCTGTDALELTVTGGLFDSSVTSVEYTTKSGYEATGSTTNTEINTSKYYFIASAAAPRHFLKAAADGNLTQEEVGSDSELFVKKDVTNYLWQFSSTSSPVIKNVKTEKCIYITVSVSRSWSWSGYTYSASSSFSFDTSEQSLLTSTSTGRQFYNSGSYNSSSYYDSYYSYLYYNSGSIGISEPTTSTSTDISTGWYLREATEFKDRSTLTPFPKKEINNTSPLSYTDSYGEVQPLTKVCRNDKVEIIVNLFYNPLTSSFDFQVEPWRTKTNETTFD
jgi:hypothetical protein